MDKLLSKDPGLVNLSTKVSSMKVYGKLFRHKKKTIYNTPDNDLIVLEKCNFVLDKSLKILEFHFGTNVGTLWRYILNSR